MCLMCVFLGGWGRHTYLLTASLHTRKRTAYHLHTCSHTLTPRQSQARHYPHTDTTPVT